MDREQRFRNAEALVIGAKKLLMEDWHDYKDVQVVMSKLEQVRFELSILTDKVLTDTLK